jgi:nucleoside-diphosphate-sugar epimerase
MTDRRATPHRSELPDRTVVTGAAGWLGRALVDRLLADGRHDLRLLVQTEADRAALPHADSIVVEVGDIGDPAVATRLLAGASEGGPVVDVVHAAGVIHPARVADFFRVNTRGTANVVDAALATGVRRLVHVSSNSPFGTNPHPTDLFRQDEPYHPYYGYGRSKMEAEQAVFAAVRGAGLDAVVVRPPWFYGPFQPPRQTTFFRMVRQGRFPIIGGGQQRRSMVYVDNLVDGILAAELAPAACGKGYWIADARPYTVLEIVDTVGRALADEGYEVKGGGTRMPAIVGRVAEVADRLVQRTGRYQQQIHVLGEMDKTIACDISASVAELGYEPRVELYEGMRRSIRWCQDQGLEL